MRRSIPCILMVAFTAAAAKPPPPKDFSVAADEAYEARRFGRCAELWLQAAATRSGEASVPMLYNAACCLARDNKTDKAFATLEQAIVAGLRDDQLRVDEDLTSLREDPRWAKILASLQSRQQDWEKTLGSPALRRELIAMRDEEQIARDAAMKAQFKDPQLIDRVTAIDKKNLTRMKEIVAANGWPGKSLVGRDGARSAWLLVQQANQDLAFQKVCLAKMEALVKAGEVDPADWAYLVDRVAVAEKRKQVYGTQLDNKGEPVPIDDEARVDERRKTVGLQPLAEYREQIRRMYGTPN